MRGLIYDAAIRSLTKGWYRHVLDRLEPDTHLLDVGIGTGGALCANAETVRSKRLRVTGVDIDAAYIERCRRQITKAGLDEHVQAHHQSIYDHEGGPYEAAYFSASFMLMPDPAACLRHVTGLLSDGGLIYFTQTFQERESRLVEKAKPLLKKVTTIDFGTVTYEQDFRETVEGAGVDVIELVTMSRSVDGTRTYRLAVGRPRA